MEQLPAELAEAAKSFTSWLSGSASHRAFFVAREAWHDALRESEQALCSSLTSTAELENYYECLVDAHTIEDAIGWHVAISGALLGDRQVLAALRGRPHYHTFTSAVLDHRLAQHAQLIKLLLSFADTRL